VNKKYLTFHFFITKTASRVKFCPYLRKMYVTLYNDEHKTCSSCRCLLCLCM